MGRSRGLSVIEDSASFVIEDSVSKDVEMARNRKERGDRLLSQY